MQRKIGGNLKSLNPDTESWRQYYEQALSRKHAARTEAAVQLDTSKVPTAVDCGCGTGGDIAFLSERGYNVFGFDPNPDAVAICRERFADSPLVKIARASFEDFDYPDCSLIVANSSLFFADPTQFEQTWLRITRACHRAAYSPATSSDRKIAGRPAIAVLLQP